MSNFETDKIKAAELVFPCGNLSDTLDFYSSELGFRIDSIYPADSPRIACISGHGLHIRLEHCSDPEKHVLPSSINDIEHIAREVHGLIDSDDIEIDLAPHSKPPDLPALVPSLVVQKYTDKTWGTGRAGMQYRDLIPDRLGGRYIASHIRIPDGGPVPDYVHHHHVRFQMIYCYKGWVKVVYEDQGPPLVMHAGDCVLQPPHIRHRVLECSDQMEVIEITCPAEHETLVDHDMELPTNNIEPDRDFNGQLFVYHRQEDAEWQQSDIEGLEARDTGIAAATDGLVSAQVIRPTENTEATDLNVNAGFNFNFVLHGLATLRATADQRWTLESGDSFVIPADMQMTLHDFATDLELLRVTAD
jgi:quercetin dioxygenase-like cupin family protein